MTPEDVLLGFGWLAGGSAAITRLTAELGRIDHLDAPVLVHGEVGTGKALVARTIHARSTRAGAPFVALNCARLHGKLIECALFGSEKGLYTGGGPGQLIDADGGTLFLAEVDALTPLQQAKLLRLVRDHEFEPIGSTRTIHVDVRLIAATRRDPWREVSADPFRADLYFHRNVVPIEVPPLRARVVDIPELARYFILRCKVEAQRDVAVISGRAMDSLRAYHWPGNVRELRSAIEWAVLSAKDVINLEDLPDTVVDAFAGVGGRVSRFHRGVVEAKKQMVREALQEARGNHADAARALEVTPEHLQRLVRNFRLTEVISVDRPH